MDAHLPGCIISLFLERVCSLCSISVATDAEKERNASKLKVVNGPLEVLIGHLKYFTFET
jgi:hypothetical protein